MRRWCAAAPAGDATECQSCIAWVTTLLVTQSHGVPDGLVKYSIARYHYSVQPCLPDISNLCDSNMLCKILGCQTFLSLPVGLQAQPGGVDAMVLRC